MDILQYSKIFSRGYKISLCHSENMHCPPELYRKFISESFNLDFNESITPVDYETVISDTVDSILKLFETWGCPTSRTSGYILAVSEALRKNKDDPYYFMEFQGSILLNKCNTIKFIKENPSSSNSLFKVSGGSHGPELRIKRNNTMFGGKSVSNSFFKVSF